MNKRQIRDHNLRVSAGNVIVRRSRDSKHDPAKDSVDLSAFRPGSDDEDKNGLLSCDYQSI